MTAHRLTKIEIENFRSINETVTVHLDAPVVLIHGPNGAGKTSLLSAIELALTGGVPSLERADSTYGSQLLHYGTKKGRVALEYETAAGPQSAEVKLERTSFDRTGGLSKDQAQFFSERCFLAQSLLSQLLTLYQQSGSDLESPLSRFVNELLGLDRLDAIERGLRPALDLRNTRKIAPSYVAVERERDRLRAQVLQLQEASTNARAKSEATVVQLAATLGRLAAHGVTLSADQDDLLLALEPGDEVQDIRKFSDAVQRTSVAARTWGRLSEIRSASEADTLDAHLRESEVELERWRASQGAVLAALFVRAAELGLPPSSTSQDIGQDLSDQRVYWAREISRLAEQLQKDEIAVERVRVIEDEQSALTVRLTNIGSQLETASDDADGLSRALATILPHVHEPDCPVCGRDFSEVSDTSLTDRLAARIAELGDVAERLTQLSRDHAASTRRQAELSREAVGLSSMLIPADERLRLESRLAKIEAIAVDGAALQDPAAVGARLLLRNTEARRSVELWSSLDSEERALRDDLSGLAADVGLAVDWARAGFAQVITELEQQAAARLSRSRAIQDIKLVAVREVEERAAAAAAAAEAASQQSAARKLLERVVKAHTAAEAVRATSKALLQAVSHARSEVVGLVFNDRLNKVWRDLFVRLAPSEAFVPSFFLPTDGEANEGRPTLLTLHRSGDQGGAPGAMLSAGNLNTAALTLFMALHLSVQPKLPWLLLDDPVQSMDEVHISQFAALLRTLSKEHGRQVFIAVHDRPLFEYLSLELSPAFNGDELITIEISASSSGRTRVSPRRHRYREDLAIVHAA